MMIRLCFVLTSCVAAAAGLVTPSQFKRKQAPNYSQQQRVHYFLATRGSNEFDKNDILSTVKDAFASVFDNNSNNQNQKSLLEIITTTPTPGFEDLQDLPVILPLLLLPAGGLVLPNALAVALAILLAVAVVLEETKPPESRNIVMNAVASNLRRPTPGLPNIYLPLGYPLVLALGAVFLPLPTKVAFLVAFGGVAVLSAQDYVLALVTAILTTGIVGIAVNNPDEAWRNLPLLLGGFGIVGGALFLAQQQQQERSFDNGRNVIPNNTGNQGIWSPEGEGYNYEQWDQAANSGNNISPDSFGRQDFNVETMEGNGPPRRTNYEGGSWATNAQQSNNDLDSNNQWNAAAEADPIRPWPMDDEGLRRQDGDWD